MKIHIGYDSIMAAALSAALLTTPAASAVAQGCSEQLAENFLAGWTHDLPKLLSTFADDAVYEDTAVHATLHGKDEIRRFAEGWFKAFPDLSFTLTSTIVSGDRAAVAWQVTGTQKGDMPGMPASNKTANQPGVSLMDCAGGKITHVTDYYDMATTMRQLGFLPSPPTN